MTVLTSGFDFHHGDFLLVFCSNHCSKMYHFWAVSMRQMHKTPLCVSLHHRIWWWRHINQVTNGTWLLWVVYQTVPLLTVFWRSFRQVTNLTCNKVKGLLKVRYGNKNVIISWKTVLTAHRKWLMTCQMGSLPVPFSVFQSYFTEVALSDGIFRTFVQQETIWYYVGWGHYRTVIIGRAFVWSRALQQPNLLCH